MRNNHHIMLAVLFLIVSISAEGQFYPYCPPLNQQQIQSAREYGADMFNKIKADLIRKQMENPTSCMQWIGSYIADNNLTEAEKWCSYLKATKEKASGYFFHGLVLELQGYPFSAKDQYKAGMQLGHMPCAEYLNRLNTEGELTEQQKYNIRMYFKNLRTMSYNMANQIVNDNPIRSSKSYKPRSHDIDVWKDKRKNCTNCRGTGIDPKYMSMALAVAHLGYFHQDGTIKCKYCGEYGKHWHQICFDCTIKKYH